MLRVAVWLAVTCLSVVLVAGCSGPAAEAAPTEPAITKEEIEGSELERLTLSESSAVRLGVQTTPVVAADVSGRTAIPHSAVIYDADGAAWAYENVGGLTYLRHPLTVEAIVDDVAVLSEGPELASLVVTVGAAELYGAETGVGGGH